MPSLKDMLEKARRAVLRKGVLSQDADDLIQEAFLRVQAYEQREVIKSREAMLVTTAVNLSRDKARRRKASPFVDVASDFLPVADDAPSAEEAMQAQAKLRRAAEGLDRLPERTRRMLLTRRLDGTSFEQIALAEGMTPAAVQKQIIRATLELKKWMDGW